MKGLAERLGRARRDAFDPADSEQVDPSPAAVPERTTAAAHALAQADRLFASDPVYLYTDDTVAIDPARRLNNGKPSFLAKLIHAAGVRLGDHVGTGTGYYTAVMRHLAGADAHVTGIEVDPDLAARTRANFGDDRGAAVLAGNGSEVDFAPADVVKAGAVRPAAP